MTIRGFYAYPSQPAAIGAAITAALPLLERQWSAPRLDTWEENDIAGRFIVDPILSKIDSSDILVADITRLNFNVVFEIGYAIGRKKRVFLTRYSAITASDELIRDVGVFDTLGYRQYSNSQELAEQLRTIQDTKGIAFDDERVNAGAPVYVVLPRIKTDAEVRLISRVKKARLQFRTFDPEEQGRLSASEAIENVAQSHGVVTILLSKDRIDAPVQNFRAAFTAGLSLAMDRQLLLLQEGDDPVPLDYRDLVKSFKFPEQIDEHVAEFATDVGARLQLGSVKVVGEPKTFLERLNLGASAAENELQDLGHYYIQTDEFRRALSGEIRVVAGRKGAGKTALFAQLRDKLRQDKGRIVLDLRPEGFQLLKFKQRVLDFLEEGTKEHTITVFWEYLLLLEACHKILEKDKMVHMRDHRIYDLYRKLADSYESDEFVTEGDFAERILKLTERIASRFSDVHGTNATDQRLNSGEITELLHKHDVADLRQQVVEYLSFKEGLWILFDNLDKGWPAHGVSAADVLTLRCLIDALTKLQRDLQKRQIECQGIVFIRNDVYELLVAETADRGKIASINLDWTDPELLRELLRRRFLYSGIKGNPSFDEIWREVAVTHYKGEETSQYLIDRSLMRPRALIELIRYCRSHAVNLGHTRIEVHDLEHGEEAYSTNLLENIDYEIRDVLPAAGNILYEFIGAPDQVRGDRIRAMLEPVVGGKWSDVLALLLWYGVFGVIRAGGETAYIYGVKYDIRRLQALVKTAGAENTMFRINPAFHRGLEISVA